MDFHLSHHVPTLELLRDLCPPLHENLENLIHLLPTERDQPNFLQKKCVYPHLHQLWKYWTDFESLVGFGDGRRDPSGSVFVEAVQRVICLHNSECICINKNDEITTNRGKCIKNQPSTTRERWMYLFAGSSSRRENLKGTL